MRRLLICADDLGLSRGTNQAILRCYRAGLITMTTLVPTGRFFEEGAAAVRELGIPCGVHLTVATEFDRAPMRPLLAETPATPEGAFHPNVHPYLDGADPELICREFRAQIRKVLDRGIRPNHLDSHMHVFSEEVLDRLGEEFQLPVRDRLELHPGVSGTLFHLTTAGETVEAKTAALVEFLKALPAEQNVIVTHPTDDPEEMAQYVSPVYAGRHHWQTVLRVQDTACLGAPEVRALLAGGGFALDHRLEV